LITSAIQSTIEFFAGICFKDKTLFFFGVAYDISATGSCLADDFACVGNRRGCSCRADVLAAQKKVAEFRKQV